MKRTSLSLAGTIAVAGAFIAAVPAHAASPTITEPACSSPVSFGRFLAGEPSFNGSRGRVEAANIDVTPKIFTRESLGLGTSVAGDRFGAAVAEGAVETANCADFAVGAPGRHGGAGEVDLVVSGSNPAAAVAIALPANAKSADQLGSSIVVNNATASSDIWASAPGATVAGKHGAGEVLHWRYSSDNGVGTITGPEVITQNTSGIPGSATTGNHFGERLGDYAHGVLVGDPSETVAGHQRAGRAYVLQVTSNGLHGYAFDENTKGVAGAPAAGDEFGEAVNISQQHLTSGTYQGQTYRDYLAVGIPGRKVSTHAHAGAVQLFTLTDGGGQSFAASASSRYTMNSAGIPGTAGTGARFGERIVGTAGIFCSGGRELDVSAPDATVAGHKKAGEVIAIERRTSATTKCRSRLLARGGALAGSAHSNDQVGADLAPDGVLDPSTILEIGLPGLSERGATGQGVVLGYAVDYTDGTQAHVTFRPAKGSVSLKNDAFGAVLAS